MKKSRIPPAFFLNESFHELYASLQYALFRIVAKFLWIYIYNNSKSL